MPTKKKLVAKTERITNDIIKISCGKSYISFRPYRTSSCSLIVIQSVVAKLGGQIIKTKAENKKRLPQQVKDEFAAIKIAFTKQYQYSRVLISQQNNGSRTAIKALKLVGFKRSASFSKVVGKQTDANTTYGIGYFWKWQSIDQ